MIHVVEAEQKMLIRRILFILVIGLPVLLQGCFHDDDDATPQTPEECIASWVQDEGYTSLDEAQQGYLNNGMSLQAFHDAVNESCPDTFEEDTVDLTVTNDSVEPVFADLSGEWAYTLTTITNECASLDDPTSVTLPLTFTQVGSTLSAIGEDAPAILMVISVNDIEWNNNSGSGSLTVTEEGLLVGSADTEVDDCARSDFIEASCVSGVCNGDAAPAAPATINLDGGWIMTEQVLSDSCADGNPVGTTFDTLTPFVGTGTTVVIEDRDSDQLSASLDGTDLSWAFAGSNVDKQGALSFTNGNLQGETSWTYDDGVTSCSGSYAVLAICDSGACLDN